MDVAGRGTEAPAYMRIMRLSALGAGETIPRRHIVSLIGRIPRTRL